MNALDQITIMNEKTLHLASCACAPFRAEQTEVKGIETKEIFALFGGDILTSSADLAVVIKKLIAS